MNTRLLQAFLVLTQVGNITNAAEALHTSQPSLSRQLKALEDEVGAQLFVRGKRLITLTDAGSLFAQRAQVMLDYLDQTKRDLQAQKTGLAGKIRIGCVESHLSAYVAKWLATFQRQHPNVTFAIYSADGNAIRTQIDQGNLDIGFLIEPVESAKYETQHIPVTETWGLMMAKDAPLAHHATVTGADLAGLPLLGARRSIVINQVSSWLKIDADTLNLRGERNLENNVLPLITQFGYYDISIDGMQDFTSADQFAFVPFSPLSQTQHTLIYRKNHQLPPTVAEFVKTVTAEIAKMPTTTA
ncbi:LysR family transcriptional regulator [Levilactobacillus lanxiensis]|uniref:LysR family transcriptional regulator n=1 Tax=Levilactobacillus lanxiensis TaxID=2799568 RepID=A0ABW4CYW6_9LACO|nr:LysR family transcriptional regulator [Levilactobacillus lanxiensis]